MCVLRNRFENQHILQISVIPRERPCCCILLTVILIFCEKENIYKLIKYYKLIYYYHFTIYHTLSDHLHMHYKLILQFTARFYLKIILCALYMYFFLLFFIQENRSERPYCYLCTILFTEMLWLEFKKPFDYIHAIVDRSCS